MTLELAKASRLAIRIICELECFCARDADGRPMIQIAGSIRRRRPFVNDIDLVVLTIAPHFIRERIKRNSEIVTDGMENLIARFPPGRPLEEQTQLDVFFAREEKRDLLRTVPTNFGSLLLCRTGSKEHNIYLVQRAKELGRKWNPYAGVFDADGTLLASATEADIFTALDLDFIPPEKRER